MVVVACVLVRVGHGPRAPPGGPPPPPPPPIIWNPSTFLEGPWDLHLPAFFKKGPEPEKRVQKGALSVHVAASSVDVEMAALGLPYFAILKS